MSIPKNIQEIIKEMNKAGFEAYIVGGCVRDLLLGKVPKDWDITTNARPDEMLKIFKNGKYENDFGTVLIPVKKGDAAHRRTFLHQLQGKRISRWAYKRGMETN